MGYRQRSHTDDLEDLIEDHLDDLPLVYDERFRSSYGSMHARVRDLFETYVRCGDPHFGFLRLRCTHPNRGEKTERIVPYSGKSRGLCPSCGQKRTLLRAERMVEEVLLHVPYVQLVFTIPKMLRRCFLWDRDLYGDLFRAAYQAAYGGGPNDGALAVLSKDGSPPTRRGTATTGGSSALRPGSRPAGSKGS